VHCLEEDHFCRTTGQATEDLHAAEATRHLQEGRKTATHSYIAVRSEGVKIRWTHGYLLPPAMPTHGSVPRSATAGNALRPGPLDSSRGYGCDGYTHTVPGYHADHTGFPPLPRCHLCLRFAAVPLSFGASPTDCLHTRCA